MYRQMDQAGSSRVMSTCTPTITMPSPRQNGLPTLQAFVKTIYTNRNRLFDKYYLLSL